MCSVAAGHSMLATYTTYRGRMHVKNQRSISRTEVDAEGLRMHRDISLSPEFIMACRVILLPLSRPVCAKSKSLSEYFGQCC